MAAERRAGGPPDETVEELYERAPVGYLTTTVDGVVLRINQTLLDWLGRPRAAVLGGRMQQLLTPGARIFYETHCAPILRIDSELRQIALDLACADGGRLPALLDWRRVDGEDGEALGHRVMVVEANERRAYERELVAERERAREAAEALRKLNAELEARVEARTAELLQLQKIESIGQLTGGIAHDFNNLLTPIVGTLDILRRRASLDERNARLLGLAIEAAERSRVLVDRLLAFARRQHLEARAVDVGGLVLGMRDLVARSIGPMVALTIDVAPDLPSATVDPNQLELAILNLCVNARDAMAEQGSLTIKVEVGRFERDGRSWAGARSHVASAQAAFGPCLRIGVIDRGSGMDEATLKRATEPFFSTKGPGRGTGLGLSMVQGLALQSGGALEIGSEPGKGTAVSILLPLAEADAPAAAVAAPAAEAPALSPLTVLLVDDEPIVRTGVASMLRELGHGVEDVGSGAIALIRLQEKSFDLLVTDYAMRGMHGLALIEAARKIRANLPALLITGFAALKEDALGNVPRLAKPFREATLAAAVAAAVRSIGPSQQVCSESDARADAVADPLSQ